MSDRIDRVGVIGGGTMGVGIAYVFAAAGCHVSLVEPVPERAEAAAATIVDRARGAAERGKLDAALADTIRDRVRTLTTVDELEAGLDLLVESVPERLDLKRDVLARAEARDPRLLASNTSGLAIGDLAAPLHRPADFLGLHFFNPVWSMPLIEIVRGADTGDRAVQLAQHAADLVGKETILVRDAPGFATSRLGVALGLEAIRMLEDGVAEAADIDRAMELGYRHPMGPLRLTDLVGLDVRLHIANHLAESLGPRFTPPRLLVDKVAAGQLGRKSGRGFYDWPD